MYTEKAMCKICEEKPDTTKTGACVQCYRKILRNKDINREFLRNQKEKKVEDKDR